MRAVDLLVVMRPKGEQHVSDDIQRVKGIDPAGDYILEAVV